MRQDEFDNYGIKNPDGKSEKPFNVGKVSYSNDRSGYIKENFTRDVKETSSVQEEFFAQSKRPAPKAGGRNAAPSAASPASPVPPASPVAPALNVTSVTATVGSGIGAAVGVVATAVVAAVAVVTVILSVLSVNISLVLADVDRLVFQMEVEVEKSEGEGEAQMPAFIATLEGSGGFFKEKSVVGNCMFSFEGLEPNKEYFLTVKGEDGKVYVNQSYCTAAIPPRTASLEVATEENEVRIYLSGVSLGKNEMYTVTAKDDAGKILFAADDTRDPAEFSFRLEANTSVFVSVRVGNASLAACRVEAASEPLYSYADAIWDWGEGGELTVTVPRQGGGDPLVLFPEVSRAETPAACEQAGSVLFSAVIYDEEGQRYLREKTVAIPALGHDYGELIEAIPASCEEAGSIAHYCCAACEKFFNAAKEEIGEEDLTVAALGHDYGEINEAVPASCEETGLLPYYQCSACEKYFDEEKSETTLSALTLSALGHDYGELIEAVPASCEEAGSIAYYCCASCEKFFNAAKAEIGEEDLIVAALGHDYGAPAFVWTPVYDSSDPIIVSGAGQDDPSSSGDETPIGFTAVLRCVCRRDALHVLDTAAAVNKADTAPLCDADGYSTYTASATYDGENYEEDHVFTYEGTALGHREMELYGRIPATFEHAGRLEHWVCGVCGKTFADEAAREPISNPNLAQLTSLDGKVFTSWNESDSLPAEEGNYYLTENVVLTETWEIAEGKEINLCLNGHAITMEAFDARFLNLGENATFGLYECDDSVGHYYYISQDSLLAELQTDEEHEQSHIEETDIPWGIFYGGYISSCMTSEDGAVIYAEEGSVVNLKGGTIIGNATNGGSGGVYYSAPNVNATLNLAGANLIGNTASTVNSPSSGSEGAGGAVYSGSGVVTLSAGELLYNAACRAGTIRAPSAGIEGAGIFTMSGGRIAYSSNDYLYQNSEADGIIVIDGGTFVMTGGVIENNKKSGVAVVNMLFSDPGGVFRMTGGAIRNNENSGGVYVRSEDQTFLVSGGATITGNAECNVRLGPGAVIVVDGAWTGEIGFLAESYESGAVTSGYGENNEGDEIAGLFSDYPKFRPVIRNGEIELEELIGVWFDSDGGSEVPPQYLEDGDYVTRPEDPTLFGWRFDGWYRDSDHMIPFDFDEPVHDLYITLYANWISE
ncbi:MAG: InlB B-repeat-containing protein [Clostridia bacterium]|nr:InlB B-repeat-containing protein [Clostridia bacterium]